MQNAIHFEQNNCVVSEANSLSAQTKGSDSNVFTTKSSDMPSMSSATAHHNHNQMVSTATNSCHKNSNTNTNSLNTNCSSPKLNLMAELFESEEDDDDNSEVLIDDRMKPSIALSSILDVLDFSHEVV